MNLRAAYDRYPFDSPWLRSVVARYWLLVWFIANSIVGIGNAMRDTGLLFFDARLYLLATRAWLAGGDPWSVQLAGNFFAAPPPSLLPLAPFAVLPIDVGVALIAGLVILAAVATVRLLHLPWWWILFPPLVQSVLSANVQALLVPLILMRLGGVATILKIYAAVPLLILGRWRAALVAFGGLVATAPLVPWMTYLADFTVINMRLVEQTDDVLPVIVLVVAAPFALVAMWRVGRERAAWLAVPALWPAQQYYYGTLAMGARSGLAAAIVALPVPGSGLWALLVLAFLEWGPGPRTTLPERWSRSRGRTIGAVTARTGPIDSDP